MNPDAIIIGGGGGGPVVAKELAEAGLQVTLLEAGPWLDPNKDFTRLEHDMGGIIDGRFRWGPTDRSKTPWTRRRDGVGFILQVAGIGGTTQHYNAISPRAFPRAFEADWPIKYEELIPWYERVEEFLPVHLVSDLATKDALFAQGCEAVGLQRSETREVFEQMWRPCHNAILPISNMEIGANLDQLEGCTMCGHCLIGCANPAAAPAERKAKRATNVSYMPAAVATGNCEVVTNAFATKLLYETGDDRQFKIRGVEYRDQLTGNVFEIEAPKVVLAAGSIESPRLWLNSGLPAGAVGRYLTTHFQDFVTGFFEREVNPDVGQVTMARADFPGSGTMWVQGYGPAAFAQVLTVGNGYWEDATPPFDLVGRAWGEKARRLIDRYHQSLTIAVSTDDDALAENGVTLAQDWPADEHGSVPQVRYHSNNASAQRRDFLAVKAAEILRAAGANIVHRSNVWPALLTHIMGTMRMGDDPSTSVCDSTGETHAVEGLFIGDSSILSNGLGGPNPTLTAQALAARTATLMLTR